MRNGAWIEKTVTGTYMAYKILNSGKVVQHLFRTMAGAVRWLNI
jgi:hypothetical protein